MIIPTNSTAFSGLAPPGAPGALGARRLRIEHRTGFRYGAPVAASYNEARMTPLTTPSQTVLESRIEVTPVSWSTSYWDYWGAQVSAFEVHTPHEELTVVSRSMVETSPPLPVLAEAGWDALAEDRVYDTSCEWLDQTPYTAPVEEVVDLAREAAAGLVPDQAARAVCERLRSFLEYQSGVTAVSTDAAEVWQRRQGVCQDFAHLTLGALRSLGIPARYVSGYLHPHEDAEVGHTVQGQSHAWIEWWAGEWRGFDPTSVTEVAVDHVVVARGRDYGDVPPLKGVYAGGIGSTLFVSVEVTRLV